MKCPVVVITMGRLFYGITETIDRYLARLKLVRC